MVTTKLFTIQKPTDQTYLWHGYGKWARWTPEFNKAKKWTLRATAITNILKTVENGIAPELVEIDLTVTNVGSVRDEIIFRRIKALKAKIRRLERMLHTPPSWWSQSDISSGHTQIVDLKQQLAMAQQGIL